MWVCVWVVCKSEWRDLEHYTNLYQRVWQPQTVPANWHTHSFTRTCSRRRNAGGMHGANFSPEGVQHLLHREVALVGARGPVCR